MQPHTACGLDGWQRLIGRWATEATHPQLPGALVHGSATFEWFDGRQFVIHRTHYDHLQIPDAISIIGVTDARLSMHYFDYRGVYRLLGTSLEHNQWRFWHDAPGFNQRFTGILSEDDSTIAGQAQLSRDGTSWSDDLAVTYRRSPAPRDLLAHTHPDLDAMARRVIDANHYMTLATTDPDGRPRLSPVYYTPARYSDFYWVSSPQAQHSRNLAERPDIEIVIFDSTAPVGEGEAVYVTAAATAIPDDALEAVCCEAFRITAGARRFTPQDLRGDALRLYVGRAKSCHVHIAANHPTHGRGIDTRQQANPSTAT
jgi:hypothetical protein